MATTLAEAEALARDILLAGFASDTAPAPSPAGEFALHDAHVAHPHLCRMTLLLPFAADAGGDVDASAPWSACGLTLVSMRDGSLLDCFSRPPLLAFRHAMRSPPPCQASPPTALPPAPGCGRATLWWPASSNHMAWL